MYVIRNASKVDRAEFGREINDLFGNLLGNKKEPGQRYDLILTNKSFRQDTSFRASTSLEDDANWLCDADVLMSTVGDTRDVSDSKDYSAHRILRGSVNQKEEYIGAFSQSIKEKEIEAIINEKWRYLVMQFGGVFLTELRPNRCFIGNKSLSDMLVKFDDGKYSLNLELLGNYVENNCSGPVQIHFSDIMFNPKVREYDLFSITSGDIRKSQIYLDLAKFLSVYNKGKETVIPVHLPYFERFKTEKDVREYGQLSEDGKRDAVMKAEKVLRNLEKQWPAQEVRIALETGNGECEKNGHINYALIYEPHYMKFLMQAREGFITLCEDVGHLNLIETDWKDYLSEHISEFHVSGNDGKEDLHTVATANTLKGYNEIVSFLKFYNGNVCAEIGRGNLSIEEFFTGIKTLAFELFSEPAEKDFEMLRKIEKYLHLNEQKISEKNLNDRYAKYKGL